jgi:hypothetical protein
MKLLFFYCITILEQLFSLGSALKNARLGKGGIFESAEEKHEAEN